MSSQVQSKTTGATPPWARVSWGAATAAAQITATKQFRHVATRRPRERAA